MWKPVLKWRLSESVGFSGVDKAIRLEAKSLKVKPAFGLERDSFTSFIFWVRLGQSRRKTPACITFKKTT